MKSRVWIALALALMLVLAACGDSTSDTTEEPTATTATTAAPEPTTTTEAPTTTTTEAMAAVGTADNPIKVLFVPSVSADEIIAGGEILDDTLTAATGLEFDVNVGSSYAATIEEMCASPENTIGFIPATGYILANDLCGVEMSLKAKRFGYFVYWTQFIVPRDSDIDSIDDLAGKTWAIPEFISTSGYLVPSGLFATLGIETGDIFEAGGHSNTVRAVYNGEADFGTVFFSPVTDNAGVSQWDDDPANADVTNFDECYLVAADQAEGKFAEGDLVCGDVEIKDARANIRTEAPDVIEKVKIIGLTDAIPNDGMAFGPDFPTDLKDRIVQAMLDFAANDSEGFSTAMAAYDWTDAAPTSDSEFDSIRALMQALGFSLDDFTG